MIEECVIIGGGVAGLSAANHLADAGLSPLIIEANGYPAHRICGEFVSHECLPILRRWSIPLSSPLTHCRFLRENHQIEFPFPIHPRSCSRLTFDALLFERAKCNGVRALTNTKVISLHVPEKSSDPYALELSNGQRIEARHLMIGTGRIPNDQGIQYAPPLKYVGFKAHFEGIPLEHTIEMHLFDGGYLGISRITDQTTNIACLMKKDYFSENDSPGRMISQLQNDVKMQIFKERMSNARMIFPEWLSGELPEFGIRTNPKWDRVFWIGDAAGSIPPICGDGLALAVLSGCMAADYLMKSDAKHFQGDWLKRVKKRFFYARQLHRIMLNPVTSTLAFKIGNLFPQLPIHLWKATREEIF